MRAIRLNGRTPSLHSPEWACTTIHLGASEALARGQKDIEIPGFLAK
jgi:hypothetical protein